MKYKKALVNKIARIIRYVEEEVRIGKCTAEDIEDIAEAIGANVQPYRSVATPAEIDAQVTARSLDGTPF